MKKFISRQKPKCIAPFRTFLARLVFFVFLALLVPGCYSIGRKFPEVQVPQIKAGQTTQNEIRAIFGTPWRVGIEDGEQAWTYGNYKYSLFEETKATDLVVRFDDNGLVTIYKYSTTEHDQ